MSHIIQRKHLFASENQLYLGLASLTLWYAKYCSDMRWFWILSKSICLPTNEYWSIHVTGHHSQCLFLFCFSQLTNFIFIVFLEYIGCPKMCSRIYQLHRRGPWAWGKEDTVVGVFQQMKGPISLSPSFHHTLPDAVFFWGLGEAGFTLLSKSPHAFPFFFHVSPLSQYLMSTGPDIDIDIDL